MAQSVKFVAASSQFAYHADQSAFDITGNMTISCWVKFTTVGSGEQLFAGKWRNTNNLRCYISGMGSGTTMYYFISSDGSSTNQTGVSVSFTPTTAKWYFFAFAYDTGGNCKFYQGDESTSPTQVGTTQTGLKTSIGNLSSRFALAAYSTEDGGQAFLDGQLYDVRLWNTNRALASIQADYNTLLVGNEANLQGNWVLNGDYTDKTSNANTLTASGSPTFVNDSPIYATASSRKYGGLGMMGIGN